MRFMEYQPKNLPEELWESYFQNREELYREENPRDPLPSRQLRREYMLDPHPDYEVSWWLALDDESNKVLGNGDYGG